MKYELKPGQKCQNTTPPLQVSISISQGPLVISSTPLASQLSHTRRVKSTQLFCCWMELPIARRRLSEMEHYQRVTTSSCQVKQRRKVAAGHLRVRRHSTLNSKHPHSPEETYTSLLTSAGQTIAHSTPQTPVIHSNPLTSQTHKA